MALLRRAIPISRLALAGWAWRNRDELLKWAKFAVEAAPRAMQGDADDVRNEAKLRTALARDPRTRGARGLDVRVENGVAHLTGTVPLEVKDAAREIAERSRAGRVRDGMQVLRRRRGLRLRHA